MESHRTVTRFAVWTYALLGVDATAEAVLIGDLVPLIVWILMPLGCLAAVLVQFAIVGPLMLLTAWLVGGLERSVARPVKSGSRLRGKAQGRGGW